MSPVAAVQQKLHGGFHWTELYLGALLALLGVLGAALLYWEYQNHKRKKDLARTADNLRFNADANFLKRLIGEVRWRPWVIGIHNIFRKVGKLAARRPMSMQLQQPPHTDGA